MTLESSGNILLDGLSALERTKHILRTYTRVVIGNALSLTMRLSENIWFLGLNFDLMPLFFPGNQGYGSHNTGSTAEKAKSYIPGTDANRESRYEQGRDTGRDSYTGTGSGNQGYGNQGYSGGNTGSNTGGRGVASYVPGTEANRESRAEHGQDPNRYTGSGSGNQGYGSNTSSGQQWQTSALPLLYCMCCVSMLCRFLSHILTRPVSCCSAVCVLNSRVA